MVAVLSQATALALRNRGYRIRQFEVLKNGVDGELFNPDKKDPALHDALGGGRTLLLYAGRLSKEKGREGFATGYLEMLRGRGSDDVRLVVAGDGPLREELETLLGPSAIFTGFLRAEELAGVYASCDVFAFPSTTDTLGRAVARPKPPGSPPSWAEPAGPASASGPASAASPSPRG